eukprot:TRINITY_DN7932_c0_g1_i1.p1 TRINITY_DN7932_c0_g1~~TRINITY_DN7932_c0_g1_i1.p1  ORF type:complete len:106 (-),score=12.33 TRINITY_DN7932_c0_g1_i1:313-630(-)
MDGRMLKAIQELERTAAASLGVPDERSGLLVCDGMRTRSTFERTNSGTAGEVSSAPRMERPSRNEGDDGLGDIKGLERWKVSHARNCETRRPPSPRQSAASKDSS